MGRPFIVLGDKTNHGGEVIEASGTTDTNGKCIARVGDKVKCPKKRHRRRHRTTEIVTGDPTMIIDGKAAARHGDRTSCGARLISTQSVTTDAC
ncbi:MAG: PAAR domain-containing protein [Rhizobacter sp.]